MPNKEPTKEPVEHLFNCDCYLSAKFCPELKSYVQEALKAREAELIEKISKNRWGEFINLEQVIALIKG